MTEIKLMYLFGINWDYIIYGHDILLFYKLNFHLFCFFLLLCNCTNNLNHTIRLNYKRQFMNRLLLCVGSNINKIKFYTKLLCNVFQTQRHSFEGFFHFSIDSLKELAKKKKFFLRIYSNYAFSRFFRLFFS